METSSKFGNEWTTRNSLSRLVYKEFIVCIGIKEHFKLLSYQLKSTKTVSLRLNEIEKKKKIKENIELKRIKLIFKFNKKNKRQFIHSKTKHPWASKLSK